MWEPITSSKVASDTHLATSKTTPVDADELPLIDSAASWSIKKLTWANIKTTLASFFNLKTATGAVGGTNNIGIGAGVFSATVTGHANFALGNNALYSVTSGGANFALGLGALALLTTQNYNVAIGNSCLENCVSSNNVGIGTFSLRSCTSGNSNVTIGYYSQNKLETGSENIAIGVSALQNNVSGNGNVAIGSSAGLNETGSNKLYIANSSTSSPLIYGDFSTYIVRINGLLHARKTTEQLRLEYDASYYASFTVSSAGNLTLTAIGTTIYTDKVIENTVSGKGIILKSPDGTRYKITVANGGTISVAAA